MNYVTINNIFRWVIVSLLIFASIRGALVIHLNLDYRFVYPIVTSSLLLLSLYGVLKSLYTTGKNIDQLKILLGLNVLFTIIYFVISFISGEFLLLNFSTLLLLFIPPYCIFVGLILKEKQILVFLIIVTLCLSYSVFANFYQGYVFGLDGYEYLKEYRIQLRGYEIPMSISGSVNGLAIYRIGGYTGSMHDSGNLLGLISVFFIVRYFSTGIKINLLIFLVSIAALLMTQSTSNIIISLFVIIIFYGYILKIQMSFRMLAIGILFIFFLIYLFIFYNQFLQILFARVSSGGMIAMLEGLTHSSYDGMTYFTSDILSSLLLILVGHTKELNSLHSLTEIGFMNILYSYGFFHTFIYFWVLLFPTYLFFKSYKSLRKDPLILQCLAANIFGFLSLFHYGSIMRSTSIFLFFIITAMFLQRYLNISRSRI
jgi:hypothetical protein